MTQDKTFYSFEAQAGRSAVVILAGTLPPADTMPLCMAFQGRLATLARYDADVLLMVDAQGPHIFDYAGCALDGVTVVYALGDFFQGCGFEHSRPSLFVMDRNQRVLATFDPGEALADTVEAVCAILHRQPGETARDIALPAPVLMIPNIIDAAFCRHLIDEFEQGSHQPGGMASIDRFGNAIHRIDGDKKKRQDYVVEPGSPTSDRIMTALSDICLPEMKKAFQFEASFTDRVLIARYDHTGGYFKRHRDNTAPSVAFRQFAISINLNTDDYEGGHLFFPEYNGHRYRPASGAGVVFSASLLHEAAPVTKGSRYVLLTFFHNAEAQSRRLAA
jgi:predicted 2-oxoglutarate/Fe(II)-dependent dioxygenase YbiX